MAEQVAHTEDLATMMTHLAEAHDIASKYISDSQEAAAFLARFLGQIGDMRTASAKKFPMDPCSSTIKCPSSCSSSWIEIEEPVKSLLKLGMSLIKKGWRLVCPKKSSPSIGASEKLPEALQNSGLGSVKSSASIKDGSF